MFVGHTAVSLAEGPDVDVGRLYGERGEPGTDLTPAIRAVMQRLREPDAQRRGTFRPIVAVRDHYGVRVCRLGKH